MNGGGTVERLSARDPLVLGRFRLLGRLGAGGMGRVYLGRGPAGQRVAVKVMHARIAEDPGFRARFASEVAFLRKIDSPGVARLVDADADAVLPWLAMEYLLAPSLEQAVASAGPLDEPSLGVLALRLAEACADLHASRVAHRDLKPSNVLLAADRPKLIDFGIARAVDATSATQTGVVLGPPGFMSPEQALGEDPELASDVFSLAGVLVYAATGRPPFGEASNAVAMMRRIVDDEPDLSGVPGGLREVLEPCFAKDPHDRPAATDLVDRLADRGADPWPPAVVRRLAEPTPSRPAPSDPAPAPARFPRRELLVKLGIGAVGVGAVVATSWATFPASPPSRPGPAPAWTSLWEIRTDGDVRGMRIGGDTLLAATPALIYAIDPDGVVRWQVGIGPAITATVGEGEEPLYVGLIGRLVALDRQTGRQRWEYASPGWAPVAATSGGALFVSAGDRVSALAGSPDTVVWTQPVPGGPVRDLQVFDAGCVVVAESEMCALDAGSGRLLWRLPIGPEAELGLADGIAVLLTDNGLFGIDVRTGVPVWHADVRRTTTRTERMVVSGQTIAVLGADGRVHAFGLRDGVAAWEYPTTRGPALMKIVTDGALVFANNEVCVTHALDLASGEWRGDLPADSPCHLVGARDGVSYFAGYGALTAYRRTGETAW